ncbi:hypothetical protein [Candidatus Poriferisocius sp.]|uniref:hypothetical protein n=1 Tax=Candidatus Poriferisocius sp. TaxID=3101276 RepID=UPI003B5C2430
MRALLRRGLGVLTALVLVAAGCGGSGGGEVASCVLSPGNDKFCLVADPAGGSGGLNRVRALRDITVVVDGQPVLVAGEGDLGGWVEGEENLSAAGSAWVGGDAKVFDGARVEDDALVTEFAEVSDGAVVRDQAQVSDRAKVFGGAQVSDGARTLDAAVVCSEAWVYGQAVVEGEAVVCGSVPRVFSLSAWAGAGKGARAARMVAWVQGWSELGTQPVRQRAGLSGTGAHVFDDAAVSDQAWVFERAKVYGEAEIRDQARVYEHAQMFGKSKMYDQAQLYGSARLFQLSGDRHVVPLGDKGDEIRMPVFSLEDPARILWTNSPCFENKWLAPPETISRVLSVDNNLEGNQSVGEAAWTIDINACPEESSELKDTRVYGNARVYDSARVWGGSRVYGDSHVKDDARVSGGTLMPGGKYCDTLWINSGTWPGEFLRCG